MLVAGAPAVGLIGTATMAHVWLLLLDHDIVVLAAPPSVPPAYRFDKAGGGDGVPALRLPGADRQACRRG